MGRVLARVLWALTSLALATLLTLPLVSAFDHADVTWSFKSLLVACFVLSAVRAAYGVVALVVLLPIALALQYHLTPLPDVTGISEALVLACAGGAWLGEMARQPQANLRTAAPALILGLIVASSAIVDLAGLQASDPARSVGQELWRHVTTDYLVTPRPFLAFHQSVRWIAMLALVVAIELALRRRPAVGPMTVRLWLIGGAAASSFALIRVADILLRRVSVLEPDPANPHVLQAFVKLMQITRISALHSDVNAAGSYFALWVVAAALVGVWTRRLWVLVFVLPFVTLAFVLPQSRAAFAAAAVVLVLVALGGALVRRRWKTAAAIGIGVVAIGGVAVRSADSTHAPISQAAGIRLDMTYVALSVAREHPLFGVGVGGFVAASRPYITPRRPTLYGFAPRGDNAHNNFLQILAELGVPGLIAFLWLVLPIAVPAGRRWSASSLPEEGRAIAAGLAAFLISALFGHPLLTAEIALAFAVALGLGAGLTAQPAISRPSRLMTSAIVAALVVSLPWRVTARVAETRSPEVSGVTATLGELDGVPYRLAEVRSTWRFSAPVRALTLPLRWRDGSSGACVVRVSLDGLEVDRRTATTIAWTPMRLILPSARTGVTSRTLELETSDPSCVLLVGELEQR